MKIFIDENISPDISQFLRGVQTLLDQNHEFHHVRDLYGLGTPDEIWLRVLQKDANWVIFSQDKFDKGRAERQLFMGCGISVIHLESRWCRKSTWDMAKQLMKWWPVVSEKLVSDHYPTWYDVPWPYSQNFKGVRMKARD